MTMPHEKNQELIQELYNCATTCDHCATACLEEPDVQQLTRCIKLDQDCADICRLTATLLSRASEHGHHLLRECAEICEACARECDKHAHMEHCRQCAEVCHRCAEACSHMEEA